MVGDHLFHGGEAGEGAFQGRIDPLDLGGDGAGEGLDLVLGVERGLGQLAQGNLDAAGIVAIAQNLARHQAAHREQQGRRDGEDRQAGQLAEAEARQLLEGLDAQITPDKGTGAADPQQGKDIAQPDQAIAARLARRRFVLRRDGGGGQGLAGSGRDRGLGVPVLGLHLCEFDGGVVLGLFHNVPDRLPKLRLSDRCQAGPVADYDRE